MKLMWIQPPQYEIYIDSIHTNEQGRIQLRVAVGHGLHLVL